MTETKKQNVLSILTVASFVVAIFMFLFNVIGIKISAINTDIYINSGVYINFSGLKYLVEQSVKVGSTFKGISVLYDCMKYEAFFTVLSDIVFFVAIALPMTWLLLKKMVSEKSQKKLNLIIASVSFGIVVLYSLFAFILVGKYSSVLRDAYAFEELTGESLSLVKFNLSTYVYIPLIVSTLLFTAYLIIFFVKGEGIDKLSVKGKIRSYKTLLDSKIISQEEFTSLKAKAIDNLVVKASNFEKDLLDYKAMLDENIIDIDDFAKIKSRYL